HVKSDHDLPLLVAIDPHGSGQTAVDHLKEAASNYPAVLVASNLIKNNDGQYMQELDELIATARKRYPVGNRIYLAGFSGGARMVLGYAATHAVNGVIASGAFARSDELSAIKCPVMGLIGMDDFNFMETVQFLLNPSSQPSNAHIELTQASHAWPPKNRLTNAFGWFQLSNQADDRFSEKQVKQFVTAQKARIDSLIDGGDLLQAACISRNMASEETFERPGSFHSITNDIIKKAAYKQQLAQLTESLRFEMKMRQQYGKALLEKPRDWWKKELAALHEKMNSEPNEMMRMAYQRISGFIGIVCYSYAGQFAARKDTSHLRQILMVYRLAEPDNPDLKHYREVLAQLKSQQ
ncbi:MAG TPA: hypothetical protein VKA27_03915, partial [Sunxiuqinia sp.]|nr:hypothetical protein [Sunxiuqinia sp.]